MMDGTLGIGSWLGQFIARPTHPLKRHRRSGDGLRQTAVVIAIGATLAAGLFAAGNYVVTGQYAPAVVKGVIKATVDQDGPTIAATANGNEIYTGSILYIPDDGANCRQLIFDNRNGRFTDNGTSTACKRPIRAASGRRNNGPPLAQKSSVRVPGSLAAKFRPAIARMH